MKKDELKKGRILSISGRVEKVVKREGQCKLVVIDEGSGFRIFADCMNDVENVKTRKVRKGSKVALQGIVDTFGTSAVCLSDCKLTVKGI